MQPGRAAGKLYRAIIAVNDDVGDGAPIDLKSMSWSAYLRNPVVLWNHSWWEPPIGKTKKLSWVDGKLVADFEFLSNDKLASRIRNAWDKGFLRAASVGVKVGKEGNFVLKEWSIATIPADQDAVRSLLGKEPVATFDKRDDTMDEKLVRSIVAAAVAEALSKRTDDTENAIDRALAKAEEARLKRAADEKKSQDDFKRKVDAEIEKRLARAGKAKKMDGEDKEMMGEEEDKEMSKKMDGEEEDKEMSKKMDGKNKEKMEDDIEKAAEDRAELLLLVRDLLPKDFESKGKTRHELLVAAAGEEVADAAKRSEDYLLAKIETIVDRRSKAGGNGSGNLPRNDSPATITRGMIPMHSLKRN